MAKSPFPGMDPYLEAPSIWPDFHSTFLPAVRAALNQILPPPFVARIDRYVWIEEADQPRLLGKPDTYVADPMDTGQNSIVLSAPLTVTLPSVQPRGKLFLKIIDVHNHRVVTAIEMLSRANKTPGKDQEAYLGKREEYLATGTNLVEMDFLRWGSRPPVDQPLPRADYYIVVSAAAEFPRAGVWPLTIRDPLPKIPIPLYAEIEPLWLELQPCFQRAYEEGRYDQEIDYEKPPDPPLPEADDKWVRSLLVKNKSG